LTRPHSALGVADRFSAAAPTYEARAQVQRDAAAHLAAWLPEAPPAGAILEIGCGTGALTRALVQRYPRHPLHVVEISAAMVERCRTALSGTANISFHVQDAAAFLPSDPLALVASNCALHWVAPLHRVLRALHQRLPAGAELVTSIMIDPTLGELREVREAVAPHKPPRGRLPGAVEALAAVQEAGFILMRSETRTFVQTHASAGEFLRALHEMGVTGGAVSRSHQPLNRSELRAVKTLYQDRFGDGQGGVRASYHVLFVKAKRGAAS
jgi:malonyl-CoA O-methyltransferase